MGCDHKKALNFAKAGQWSESHELVQKYSDEISCLIHAYLHRVEGDLDNARYWYGQAGTRMPDNTLDAELQRLTGLLENPP
jgi:hypothetical protein